MLKHSFVYLFSGTLNRLTPFLLLPLLTRMLTTTDYGLVTLYQVAITLGVAVCGFGLHLNIIKSFPVLSPTEFGKLSFNVFLVLCGSSFLSLVVLLVATFIHDNLFGIPTSWLLTIPVISFFSMITLINQSVLRSAGKPWTYAVFEVSATALNLLVSIALVVWVCLGWHGRAAGIAFAAFIAGIMSLYCLHANRWLIPNRNLKQLSEILIFSLPFLPHTISSSIIGVSDRFFLESMVGKAELGIYSVAYSFGMVVMLFTDSFAKAWTPWFLKRMNEQENGRRKVKKWLVIYVIALTFGTAIYTIASILIVPFIVGKDYVQCVEYIPIICIGYWFFGLYQVSFPYLVFHGKSMAVGITSTLAAGINLIGNYYLIKYFGAMGAALSTVVGFFVSFLLVASFAYYLEQKRNKTQKAISSVLISS